MITGFRCKNFRCFVDTGEVDFAPLTVLVGENNSGKSSLLQALRLMNLTARSEDPAVCLRTTYAAYDFGAFPDLVHRHSEDKSIELSFRWCGDPFLLGPLLPETPEEATAELRLTYTYLPVRKEIHLASCFLSSSLLPRLSVSVHKYRKTIRAEVEGFPEAASLLSRGLIRRGFGFTQSRRLYQEHQRYQKKHGEKQTQRLFNGLFGNLALMANYESDFENVFHLGPLRVPPARLYPHSGERTQWVGETGSSAFQVYSSLLQRGTKDDKTKLAAINRSLYDLGFIRDLRARPSGKRNYEYWTTHSTSGFKANLADTGFGASQVFPVVVSLFIAPAGSTLLYEQPEIHLHPASQAQLGSVFSRATTPNKRIILETHSENLILRLQREVASGALRQNDVLFYYIAPTEHGHTVTKIPVDEKGRFLADWPKGFFEEGLDESLRLARERRVS